MPPMRALRRCRKPGVRRQRRRCRPMPRQAPKPVEPGRGEQRHVRPRPPRAWRSRVATLPRKPTTVRSGRAWSIWAARRGALVPIRAPAGMAADAFLRPPARRAHPRAGARRRSSSVAGRSVSTSFIEWTAKSTVPSASAGIEFLGPEAPCRRLVGTAGGRGPGRPLRSRSPVRSQASGPSHGQRVEPGCGFLPPAPCASGERRVPSLSGFAGWRESGRCSGRVHASTCRTTANVSKGSLSLASILGIEFLLRGNRRRRDRRGRAPRSARASSRSAWPRRTRQHRPYGGVVPEIAARAHAETLSSDGRCGASMNAGLTLADMDAIAATAGPGLIGGVMVGPCHGQGPGAWRRTSR